MEAGMMKVVFSSIINGTERELSANKTVMAGRFENSFKPENKYSEREFDAFEEKSSQEVFASLINASNCANLRNEKVLDGYITFTAEGAFLRDYIS